jgi:serine/threonine protein kinase
MLAGRYRLEEVIGRGGMSTVYRATDTLLRRPVAVKVLLAALAQSDPTHIARFEREAQAVAALQHPAVVKIFDTGVDDGRHFLVMEYVAGRSLDEVFGEGRPLTPGGAVRIAARVADALAAAHAAGILHRDIKPANVMLASDGEVKVLDFGIARPLGGVTLTQPASAIGTAAYMPPERARGQPGDERSDVYSLGCLLYAMLAGHPPFVAPESLVVLHQQVHDQPTPPRALGVVIPGGLETLVLTMLAKDPDQRPQSASEVATRLRDVLIPGASEPTRRMPVALGVGFSRNRRTPVVLAAVLAVLVLAVIALASGGGKSKPSGSSASRSARHVAPGVWTEPVNTTPVTSTPVTSTPAVATPPAATPAAPPAKPKPGHGANGPGGAGPPGHDKPGKPDGGGPAGH